MIPELRARLWLSACDKVGAAPELRGKPWILNQGRIEIGDRVRIDSEPVPSHLVAVEGGRIEIGDGVQIGAGLAMMAHALIRIGDGARIGPYLMVLDNDLHETSSFYTKAQSRPVIIGKGAVIGARVVLLRGAEIGEGARVLAGSVVSKAIPPGVIAAGVPAAPLGSWGAWATR